jgi:hypothetical protein
MSALRDIVGFIITALVDANGYRMELLRAPTLFLLLLVSSRVAVADDSPNCTTAKFVLPGGKECQPQFVCEGSKEVVDQCMNVHGQLLVRANFMIQIKADGYDRLFWPNGKYKDVSGSYLPLPADIANALTPDNAIEADYRVCPLEPRKKPQYSQEVCVERASNIKVVDVRDAK